MNRFCSLWQFLKLRTIRDGGAPLILKWTTRISAQVFSGAAPSDPGVCFAMQSCGLMSCHQGPSLRGLRDHRSCDSEDLSKPEESRSTCQWFARLTFLCPEPSTEPGQAMLGSGWASFSPSRHRLPHWKSRREIFHSFCFVLCEGNVALQEDEGRWVEWVRKPGSPPCFLSNGGIWPGRIGLFRTLLNEFLYPMVIWLPSRVYGVEQ